MTKAAVPDSSPTACTRRCIHNHDRALSPAQAAAAARTGAHILMAKLVLNLAGVLTEDEIADHVVAAVRAR